MAIIRSSVISIINNVISMPKSSIHRLPGVHIGYNINRIFSQRGLYCLDLQGYSV